MRIEIHLRPFSTARFLSPTISTKLTANQQIVVGIHYNQLYRNRIKNVENVSNFFICR